MHLQSNGLKKAYCTIHSKNYISGLQKVAIYYKQETIEEIRATLGMQRIEAGMTAYMSWDHHILLIDISVEYI